MKQLATSKEAYDSLEPESIKNLYKRILIALESIKEGTFEDIASFMLIEPVKVWKRMSELHKQGLIHRTGVKKPLKSGRNGFIWALGTGETKGPENIYAEPSTNAADFASMIINSIKKHNTYHQQNLFS